MSGEAFLPNNGRSVPVEQTDFATPRVQQLRQLVDDLRLMLASGEVDKTATRLAANELSDLAEAIAAGGVVANGFAAVLLTDFEPGPPPFEPPLLGTFEGGEGRPSSGPDFAIDDEGGCHAGMADH